MSFRHAAALCLAGALGCGLPGPGVCEDMLEAYRRAEALLPLHTGGKLPGMSVEPVWLDADRFWYRRPGPSGSEFVLVDASKGTREPTFDRAVSTEEGALRFDADEEVPSPDGRWIAFVRDHNLYLRPADSTQARPLTTDGIEDQAYGEWGDAHLRSLEARRSGWSRPPRVLWSADSKRLLSYRVDQSRVPKLPFVQMVPPGGYGARPLLREVRWPMPQDPITTTAALVLFDVETGRRTDVRDEPLVYYYDPLHSWSNFIWWDRSGEKVYYYRFRRGYREFSLSVADAATGEARQIVKESTGRAIMERVPAVTQDGADVFWLSSKDGWQHVYRYDGNTGALRGQLTRGAWRVDSIVRLDERSRWVYFMAGGREPGLDPYYLQLYRMRYDGSRLQRLTPEGSKHSVSFSPDGRYFMDRHSTVSDAPTTVLRHADGRLIRELEVTDTSYLRERGWEPARRFSAKGRDGRTDVYGNIHLPPDFDPARRYPVLDNIYGGPQSIFASASFSATGRYSYEDALAQLGFIVVTMDGMGTPGRSQAFQDVSQGRGFSDCGLPDHLSALRELASKRAYLDLGRVGIYGYSGGGYCTVRALLDHPDFYKVGVAAAGSHDQRLYAAEWGEHFIGRPDEDAEAYVMQANSSGAARLKGKLLLAHGDMDDDVHISNAMQLAHAFIEANRNFDLLVMVDRGHDLGSDPYFQRRLWDYFVTHLMGLEPPENYRIRYPAH